jgi:lipid A 4'-phosphatase
MAISGISIGAFYVYRSRLALVGIILSVIYSLMVSFARIAQGGHFLTDVAWSLIIVPIVFMIILYVCAPSEE